MRRLEVEESNPYTLSTWVPYAEIPQTQPDAYMDQPQHDGLEERIIFRQNPDWDLTFVSKQIRISVEFENDVRLIYEGPELIEGTLQDGQSYYVARVYIHDNIGSNFYPSVFRITQRWN
jgi:hypothetical protein